MLQVCNAECGQESSRKAYRGEPPDRPGKRVYYPDGRVSASADCLRPNQMLSPHQMAARGAATNEIPVRPRPNQVSSGYDQAPIWSPAR